MRVWGALGLGFGVCGAAFGQATLEVFEPPAGYEVTAITHMDHDGSHVLLSARDEDNVLPLLRFTWDEVSGLEPLPASPVGAFTPEGISGDGNVIVGRVPGSGISVAWKRSTDQYETIDNPLSGYYINFDGSRIFAQMGQTPPASLLLDWRPFFSTEGILTFNNASIPQFFGNTTGSTIYFRMQTPGPGGDGIWRYTTAQGAVQVMDDANLIDASSDGSSLLYGSIGAYFVRRVSNGVTTQLPVPPTGTFVPHGVTFNAKMAAAADYIYRADLGAVAVKSFLSPFYGPGVITSRATLLAQQISDDGSAIALSEVIDPFEKWAVLARNPETFRKKLGERYSISARWVIRNQKFPIEPGLDFDDPNNSANFYECFYSLSSSLLNPSTQNRSVTSPLSVTYGGAIGLSGQSNFVWNEGTSQSFVLNGSLSDSDGAAGNDVLLNGPFSLTKTDLRNGGKTFTGSNARLEITSTYLGVILDTGT